MLDPIGGFKLLSLRYLKIIWATERSSLGLCIAILKLMLDSLTMCLRCNIIAIVSHYVHYVIPRSGIPPGISKCSAASAAVLPLHLIPFV